MPSACYLADHLALGTRLYSRPWHTQPCLTTSKPQMQSFPGQQSPYCFPGTCTLLLFKGNFISTALPSLWGTLTALTLCSSTFDTFAYIERVLSQMDSSNVPLSLMRVAGSSYLGKCCYLGDLVGFQSPAHFLTKSQVFSLSVLSHLQDGHLRGQ